MRLRIKNLRLMDHPVFVRDMRIVAKLSVQLDHVHMHQVKLMEDPEQRMLIWPTSNLRLSNECRAVILRKVIEELKGGGTGPGVDAPGLFYCVAQTVAVFLNLSVFADGAATP